MTFVPGVMALSGAVDWAKIDGHLSCDDDRKRVEADLGCLQKRPRHTGLAASGDPAIAAQVLALLSDESHSHSSETPDRRDLANNAPPIETGRRIGRYAVSRLLGRGGMGDTWSAQDLELERPVALKFLRQDRDSQEEGDASSGAEKFIREAKAASALNHPNIVTVFEVVRSDGDLAIAMELVIGEGLRELCKQPQPAPRVVRMGEQIAEALAAAHAANILHRDIKPENLIVRPDGYVKVLDFGLARRLDAGTITHPGMPAGTFRYMSPEQSRGSIDEIDERTDIYALGKILNFLLAGRKVPRALDSIKRKATAADPAERYAGVSLLAADIQRFGEGNPVSAHDETLAERAARLAARYQTILALLLAYLFMRLLFLLWSMRRL